MILEKLQRLGMAASYDSCGGAKEKSYRDFGVPHEYQNFIYNCTQTSENVFVRQARGGKKYKKGSGPLYRKQIPSEEVKRSMRNQKRGFLNAGNNERLNKANKCLLVKVLQDNACMHDCKYCLNNSCKKQKRLSLEPRELANSFMKLHKSGFATGLFLSSAVHGDAEKSTEKMIESVKMLRHLGYRGYVHSKVLPETPQHLVEEMSLYSNRLSLNIEASTTQGFQELTSTKKYKQDILKKVRKLDGLKKKCDKKNDSSKSWFWDDSSIRNGVNPRLKSFTTQMILGANDETDKNVLKRMDSLYEDTDLYRTYFSAFSPVEGTGLSERIAQVPMREHRLYETDFLFRVYGFKRKVIEKGLNEKGNFSLGHDVKHSIACSMPELFPLDPNTATKEELMLVPNFGPKSVEKILEVREKKVIRSFEDLEKEGVRFRKAKNFVALEGKQTNLMSF